MSRLALAVLLVLTGCSLDLDRLRRGADAATGDASIDASADAGDDGGSRDAGADGGPADGGCVCTTRTRWIRAHPPVPGRDLLAVHASDLDRDGAIDVLVTPADMPQHVAYGIRPSCARVGGFDTPTPVPALPVGRVPGVVDRDGDGNADVAVPGDSSNVLLFTGETGFSRWTLLEDPPVTLDIDAARAVVTPLDFIGEPDVIVLGQRSTEVRWLRLPDRSVEMATLAAAPLAAAATSRSGGAGVITVAFATGAASVEMFRTVGSGFILDPALELPELATAVDLVFADVGGDAEEELLVADPASAVIWVFSVVDSGTYGNPQTIPVGDPPTTITTGDLDGDDVDEIVVGCRESSTIRIIDTLSRTEREVIAGVPRPRDVVVTDLEWDGLADLVVGGASETSAQLTILRSGCDL